MFSSDGEALIPGAAKKASQQPWKHQHSIQETRKKITIKT
jgi:hypothetical protein